MKLSKKKALLSLAVLTSMVGMTGCFKSNAKIPVVFVATTSSTYNAEVTIGTYSYKFQGKIDQKSNKFTLVGTTQARASSSGGGQQGGGFGGGGFPGGGGMPGQGGQGGGQGQTPETAPTSLTLTLDKTEAFINESVKATVAAAPEGASTNVTWSTSDEKIATVSSGTITPVAEGTVTITATSSVDPTVSASAQLTVKKENLAQHDYTLNGTYKLDKGYGYILTLDDTAKTVIHSDFDKVEGRHTFIYTVQIGENKSQITFQAKDPTFKNTLAKDYKSWDERDSKYIFRARATGNNGSAATSYMYMHSDGSVVINSPSGANRVVTTGLTWTEANNEITLRDGQNEYKAVKSVNAAHPGYKLTYNNTTYLVSLDENVKWKKLAISDFDGETSYEFAGSYTTSGPDGGEKAVNLNLGADGVAKLYVGGWTAEAEGTWTKTGDEITVNLNGKDPMVSTKEDGKYVFTYQITMSSWGGTTTVDVKLSQTK